MNKIKLYGKVLWVSDLKFDIYKKLRVYIEFKIQAISGDIFNCIAYDEICNEVRSICVGEYVYVLGSAFGEASYCSVYTQEIRMI